MQLHWGEAGSGAMGLLNWPAGCLGVCVVPVLSHLEKPPGLVCVKE